MTDRGDYPGDKIKTGRPTDVELHARLDKQKPDPVNHPAHYTNHPSGIECITVTRHMNFNRGNAVKYIWRAGEKGPAIEDLRKAAWYIADEIKRLESGGE